MTTDEVAALAVNDDFYRIFSEHNISGMEELWSSSHDVAVIHPGWAPLLGREAVLSSWQQIMKGDSVPDISCNNATVNILGDVALIICRELLDRSELVATNLFIRESAGWKMIHHQAGPLPRSNQVMDGDTVH